MLVERVRPSLQIVGYREVDGKPSQYNITSDYEYNFPKGVTREYWLEIDYANANLAPDGWPRDEPMKVINGTYPGPLIEANWGDELGLCIPFRCR